MTIFEEAMPLLEDISNRLLDQRLPVVAYVAAVILENALKGFPGTPPPTIEKVLAVLQEMFKFIVQGEAERIRAAKGVVIQ